MLVGEDIETLELELEVTLMPLPVNAGPDPLTTFAIKLFDTALPATAAASCCACCAACCA